MPTVDLAPVPRTLRYASWLILGSCVLMMFVGAWRIGFTTDEPYHVQRFNNYVQTGWYLTDGQVVDGQPVGAGKSHQYVYGPAAMLVLHAVNATVGVEPWTHAGGSADAYAVRHVTVAFFGLLGLLAVVLTAHAIFGRWDWAILAGATMAAVPLWTGHAMFNPKDVPVGTGYAWATFGLVLMARRRASSRGSVQSGAVAATSLGVVLAVGTRPAMWAGIALGVGVLLLGRALAPSQEPPSSQGRYDWPLIRDILSVVVLSGLLLWWMDPNVFGSPVTALHRSVTSSADFMGRTRPWFTVPVWVAIQMPLVVLVFLLWGCVVVAWSVLSARWRTSRTDTQLLIVAGQALSMPVGFMVTQSPLTFDLRQLLFAIPATAILATLGVAHVFEWLDRRERERRKAGVSLTITICLMVPVVAQGLLFPYNYAFANVLARASRVHTSGEYYRGSARELASELPAIGRVVCAPERLVAADGSNAGQLFATRRSFLNGWKDCRDSEISPIAPYVDHFHGRSRALAPDEFLAVSFDARGLRSTNCTRIAEISRRTIWQRVAMATLSVCRLAFPTLSLNRAGFARSGDADDLIPDQGWNLQDLAGASEGLPSSGDRSTMTFTLPAILRGHDVQIVLRTARAVDALVTFGGTRVNTRQASDGTGLTITIPSTLVDRAVASPQTLEFRSRNAHPLGLTIETLQLVPKDSSTND